ncbi:MAG: aspartate aminotransferase family protein [Thermoplasmata archaeon]
MTDGPLPPSSAPPLAPGEFGTAPTGDARRTIVRGEGAYLWDDAGRRYVDLGASLGVANVGHAHPKVVRAIAEQAASLLYVGSAYATEARRRFVERLLSLLPPSLDRVFLSNSGTEAMEQALKVARSSTRRPEWVAARRGFHGRTMGSLSVTWRPELREPFEPLVPGARHVAFGDAAALEEAVGPTTAAVVLEVVQGEGGVHPATPEYLRAARSICDRNGALLLLDEVQTGVGRTGRNFAFEHSGVVPDILALAKSLAGGVPIGATVVRPEVERAFAGSLHSTFGGNPLACAAGAAALEVLVEERLSERAARLGSLGLERLRAGAGPRVREVRGLGLMIGIELRERAWPYLERLRERGYLASAAGPQVIRLLPPLTIAEEDWDAALGAIAEVLGDGGA